jgi:hypothetical protein
MAGPLQFRKLEGGIRTLRAVRKKQLCFAGRNLGAV